MTPKKSVRLLAGLIAAAAIPAASSASDAGSAIFATGILAELPTGAPLAYDFDRIGTFEPDQAPKVDGGQITLTMAEEADGRSAMVAIDDTQRVREYDPFPASGGNPLVLVFLENTVRSMAALTGGSPFYIQNRIRAAIGAENAGEPVTVATEAGEVPATLYTLRPFEGDPNAERMGPFAGLEMRFTLAETVPGRIAAMVAETGPEDDAAVAFRQAITLDPNPEPLTKEP